MSLPCPLAVQASSAPALPAPSWMLERRSLRLRAPLAARWVARRQQPAANCDHSLGRYSSTCQHGLPPPCHPWPEPVRKCVWRCTIVVQGKIEEELGGAPGAAEGRLHIPIADNGSVEGCEALADFIMQQAGGVVDHVVSCAGGGWAAAAQARDQGCGRRSRADNTPKSGIMLAGCARAAGRRQRSKSGPAASQPTPVGACAVIIFGGQQ